MVDTPGNTGHLPEREAEAYLQLTLGPEARWKADIHLSSCQACRRRVHLDAIAAEAILFLEADLRATLQEEEAHLSYEEMEAYVRGHSDPILSEIVEAHRVACDLCAAELQDLQAFQKQ